MCPPQLARYQVGASLAVMLVLCPSPSFAPGSAPVSPFQLSKTAEAVIVGTVTGTAYASEAISLTVVVERSLKGALGPGKVVTLLWRDRSRHRPNMDATKFRGLLFLKRETSSGHWVVLPAYSGFISDVRNLLWIFPAASAPHVSVERLALKDRLFAELIAAIEAGGLGNRGGMVDLLASYRRDPSPASNAMLFSLASSRSPRLRMIGLRTRLANGDVPTLTFVEKEQSALMGNGEGRGMVQDLAQFFRNSDPVSVKILGRIARSAGVMEVREAAARALAMIHTREALPHLAALLDDASLIMRTYGVAGLGFFANNTTETTLRPAPGDWPYRTDETMARTTMSAGDVASREAYYVGYWKSWWLQHRNSLQAGRP